MPQKSTSSPGAITSRIDWPAAAARSARLGRTGVVVLTRRRGTARYGSTRPLTIDGWRLTICLRLAVGDCAIRLAIGELTMEVIRVNRD